MEKQKTKIKNLIIHSKKDYLFFTEKPKIANFEGQRNINDTSNLNGFSRTTIRYCKNKKKKN